jgi:hypothetical protein
MSDMCKVIVEGYGCIGEVRTGQDASSLVSRVVGATQTQRPGSRVSYTVIKSDGTRVGRGDCCF